MDKTWQLQAAKSHLSEIVERATQGETQAITKRGERAAVTNDYERYLALNGQKKSLLEALRGGKPYTDKLLFKRAPDTRRDLSPL